MKNNNKNAKKVYVININYYSLLWTRPIDLLCNILQNLEIGRKYKS